MPALLSNLYHLHSISFSDSKLYGNPNMLQQIAHEWWFFRHESRILDGCTAQKVSARLSLAETFWRSVIKTYVSRHLWILQSAFAIFEAAVQIAVETGSWGCETLKLVHLTVPLDIPSDSSLYRQVFPHFRPDNQLRFLTPAQCSLTHQAKRR